MLRQTNGLKKDKKLEKLREVLEIIDKKTKCLAYFADYSKNRAFYKWLVLSKKDLITKALVKLVKNSRVTTSKSLYIFSQHGVAEKSAREIGLEILIKFVENSKFRNASEIFENLVKIQYRFPINLIIKRLKMKMKSALDLLVWKNKLKKAELMRQRVELTLNKNQRQVYAAFGQIKLYVYSVLEQRRNALKKILYTVKRRVDLKRGLVFSELKEKINRKYKISILDHRISKLIASRYSSTFKAIQSRAAGKRTNQYSALKSIIHIISSKVNTQLDSGFHAFKLPNPVLIAPLFKLLQKEYLLTLSSAFNKTISFGFNKSLIINRMVGSQMTKFHASLAHLKKYNMHRSLVEQKNKEGMVRVCKIIDPNFFQSYLNSKDPLITKRRVKFSPKNSQAPVLTSPLYFPFKILSKISDRKEKAFKLIFTLFEVENQKKRSFLIALKQRVSDYKNILSLSNIFEKLAQKKCRIIFESVKSQKKMKLDAASKFEMYVKRLMYRKTYASFSTIKTCDTRIDRTRVIGNMIDVLEIHLNRRKKEGFNELLNESKHQVYRSKYCDLWTKKWTQRMKDNIRDKKKSFSDKLNLALVRSRLPSVLGRLVKDRMKDHFELIKIMKNARFLKRVESLVMKTENRWGKNYLKQVKNSMNEDLAKNTKLSNGQFHRHSRYIYFARLNKTINTMILERQKEGMKNILNIMKYGMIEKNSSMGTLTTRLSVIDDTIYSLNKKKMVRIKLGKSDYGSSFYHDI